MVIGEFYKKRKDNVKIFRSYSDQGVKIRKTGTDYIDNEAFDVEGALFLYIETDIPVDILKS